MTQVLEIRLSEPVSVDSDRIGALYAQLGEAGAEDILCRAMEELALRLGHCDTLYREANWPELRKNTRLLVAISDQIGMQVLARVAGHVIQSIDSSDATALAATLARLLRIGERSLSAVWESQDLSI
ncbi:MAG: hypothetical protein ACSHWZ_01490 [Sulfitobacter sp.]